VPDRPVEPVLPVKPVLPVVPIAEVESTLTESVAAASAAFCLHDAIAMPAQIHMPNANFFIDGFLVFFNYNKIAWLFKIFREYDQVRVSVRSGAKSLIDDYLIIDLQQIAYI